jgi:hypothetical protein
VLPAEDERPWLKLLGSGTLCGDPFAPVVAEGDIDALSQTLSPSTRDALP